LTRCRLGRNLGEDLGVSISQLLRTRTADTVPVETPARRATSTSLGPDLQRRAVGRPVPPMHAWTATQTGKLKISGVQLSIS
jgi:hypothetical protein